MARYVVTFDRIGRNHAVPPLTVEATNQIDLGEQIADYADPHLRSSYWEVGVSDDLTGGHFLVGEFGRPAGDFTIARVEE